MTVFTAILGQPARPARPGRRAGAEPPPVPWQGMLWVTWRQHRGLLISVLVVFAAAVAALLASGQRIHHDYAILRACRPAASPGCQGLSSYFNSTDWHLGNYLQVAVLAAPVLLSMFAGPPVVARDLENSTYRYAWTQGIGRVRWTVAKLVIIGAVVTIAALAVSQLFAWFFAPFLTTEKLTVYTPPVFATHGVAYAAWTLTAFCLGAFLGALARRILAAMAITPVVYAGLAALTWFYLRSHYPVSTFWPMQLFEACWLLVLSAALVAGTIWLVRRHAVLVSRPYPPPSRPYPPPSRPCPHSCPMVSVARVSSRWWRSRGRSRRIRDRRAGPGRCGGGCRGRSRRRR
jgi:hypothetical protein